MIILFTLLSLLVFSLIVFGGGQVFMPLFKWLWVDLTKVVSLEEANNVFALANATPGPFSTKLSLIAGRFASGGEWWGWLLMLVTFLMFIIPSMIIMYYVSKKFFKFENNIALQTGIKYTKPIIAGILFSLVFSITMSGFFPELNTYFHNMGHSNKNDFIKSHMIQLIVWSITAFFGSLYLMSKKYNLILIILANLVIGFVVFII